MSKDKAPVAFVGAGPGAPDLITLRGLHAIREADLVLYAGSLVPREVAGLARDNARVEDSSPMTLEETHALIMDTVAGGGLVARVHTGDPSLYGAVREQMMLLDREGVGYRVIPGVTAAFAAAASACVSFTTPGKAQSLIITRMEGRTPVPEGQRLKELAGHGSSMAVYLSAGDPGGVVRELTAGGYPDDTPVVIAYRVGWPEERLVSSCLRDLAEDAARKGISKQAVFLVLPDLDGEPAFSRLYSKDFSHGFRRR